MSHANRVKNASQIIGKQMVILKRSLSKEEQFDILKDKTPWPSQTIDKVIQDLDFVSADGDNR